MRTRTLCIALLLTFFKPGFSQVSDDFTDGDFLHNPHWTGDTSRFEVTSLHQLHLVSSGADTSILVTASQLLFNTEWDCWVKLAFNTSTNNFARIYLASDREEISSPLNGYYLKIGGSNDSLTLVRQSGNTAITLIKGKYAFLGNSVNQLRIKVTHDDSGAWKVYTDPLGGTNFREEGSCTDSGVPGTSWFGIFCRYTSSNASKFYFDDFYAGPILKDTVPPRILSVIVKDSLTLCLNFSESVDPVFAKTISNFKTSRGEFPKTAHQDSLNAGIIMLEFETPFKEKYNDTLYISHCKDLSGNAAETLQSPFCFYIPEAFDILIDEIMADPEPSMGLPVCEYVELFNRSAYPVCLKGWRFGWPAGEKTFPDITMQPNGLLIIEKDTLLSKFGPVLPLFTSSTTLSNEGALLTLKNEKGKIIHSITYSKNWISDPVKAEGGWSLEMIDPMNPCGCRENWSASSHPLGGTPGEVNSGWGTHPDTVNPRILRAWLDGDRVCYVLFSEPMDSSSLSDPGSWSISPDLKQPDSVEPEPPEFDKIRLHFADPFQKGIAYELSINKNLFDCAGNKADSLNKAKLALPDSIQASDLIINEILFHPYSGGKRFVELYNRSGKVLDLKDLSLADLDSITRTIEDKKSLSPEDYLIFPDDFVVLTEDPEDIRSRYLTPHPDAILLVPGLPAMNDHQGTLVLIRTNDDLQIDRVYYSESLQFSLLADREGVSLERVNPDDYSGNFMNWHSASESSGFATPGYQNSQYFEYPGEKEMLLIPDAIFSPDNDGIKDELHILFHSDGPEYTANICIFDSEGRLIRTLVRNRLLSSEDYLCWDGTDDHSQKAPIGIYLLYTELLDPAGKTRHYKDVIVLAGKF